MHLKTTQLIDNKSLSYPEKKKPDQLNLREQLT